MTTFYISVIILHMLHITNHAGLTGYDFTILFGLRYTKKKKLRTGKTGINNMVMQMRGDKSCPGRGKWVKIPLYQKMYLGTLGTVERITTGTFLIYC